MTENMTESKLESKIESGIERLPASKRKEETETWKTKGK